MSDKLKEEATELGISFEDDIEESDLQDLVNDKKEDLQNDIEHWKSEAEKHKSESKKAYRKRDTASRDKKKLSQKIKDMEGQMDDMVDSNDFDELKEQLKELKSFKKEIEDKKEKEEEEKLFAGDEAAKLKSRSDKEMKTMKEDFQEQMDDFKKELEQEREKKDSLSSQVKGLRGSTLESEIMREAAKHNAWNVDQIVDLTRKFFTYDKTLNKHTHIIRDRDGEFKDELTVAEYIEEFMGKEANENLIRSQRNTSSFNTNKEQSSDSKSRVKGFDPKDPNIIEKAFFEDMTVERYIEKVLVPQQKWKEDRNK